MAKKNKQKSKLGRKPISDKKIKVIMFIRESKIEQYGGIDSLREHVYKTI